MGLLETSTDKQVADFAFIGANTLLSVGDSKPGKTFGDLSKNRNEISAAKTNSAHTMKLFTYHKIDTKEIQDNRSESSKYYLSV